MHHSSDVEGALDPSDRLPVAGAGQAAKAALGTNAKSSTTCVDVETTQKARAARAQRHQALSQARVFLGLEGARKQVFGDKVHRTFACHYVRLSNFVQVHHSAEHQKSFYGGLVTCGSVWACPVCAAKIQERRRQELIQFIDYAYSTEQRARFPALSDGSFVMVPKDPDAPVMVTFTFPHVRFDSLEELILRQRMAFKLMREGNSFQLFKKRFGFKGLIRSLEVTHGNNGWHPHTHELWLVRPTCKAEREDFVRFVTNRWEQSCIKAGLLDPTDRLKVHAFRLHSVDVRFSVTSGEYLAKQDSSRRWGVEHEMSKATSKKGRLSGVHPHEFLLRNEGGDAALYLEYALTMRDKRCRQLYWSAGLKDLVGIDDLTDEEISERKDERADLLGLLIPEQWKLVTRAGAVAELLDCADSGEWSRVEALLKSLGSTDDSPAAETQDQPVEIPTFVREVPKHLERNSLSRARSLTRCEYVSYPFWLSLEEWSLVDSFGAAESLLGVYLAAGREASSCSSSEKFREAGERAVVDGLACLALCL
jgi:hypothetical protein